jgi:hypothetical protein
MIITVLTKAIVVILVCGLCIWLVGFLPIESRFKLIARVIIVVIGLVAIVQSLDLLALRCC